MAVVAQVGIGYWGINILRALLDLDRVEVKYACDADQGKIEAARKNYSQVKYLSDYEDIINDNEVQAVIISTPVPTHFNLAKKALAAKKHVFIEKPITLKSQEARELVKLAKRNDRKLMVGHLLLYHPVIKSLKEALTRGSIGQPLYMYFRRTNLGKVRTVENVLWSVAPHDISIFLYLLDKKPSQTTARGACYLQPDIEDVVFTSFAYESGEIVHLHNSWLDPFKERKIVVVGEKGMLVADEMASQGKLMLFNKYVQRTPGSTEFKYTDKGAVAVVYDNKEPLKAELEHFIDCLENDKEPLSNGENGLTVLCVLEAAQESLKNDARPVKIKY